MGCGPRSRSATPTWPPTTSSAHSWCCGSTRFPRRRAVRWACCALIITAIALTGSNGGALVLIVTTVLGAIFRLARRRGAVPAIITASVLALAVILIAPRMPVQSIVARAQTSSQFLNDSIGRQAESSGSRGMILTQTEQLYLNFDSPLGIGPGGTKTAFQAHQFSYVKMAHDDYAASLVERGVLGALALVCLFVIVLARVPADRGPELCGPVTPASSPGPNCSAPP